MYYPVSKSRVAMIVLVAFAVRFSFMMLLPTYQFNHVDDFSDGGETANIAQSLATGHGFSSPFTAEYTGPTAWIAPVYPFALSLVYKSLGRTETASPVFIFTIQALFSSLVIIPLVGIGVLTVGRTPTMITAWLWAVFPYFSKWSVTWVWETSLSALLVCLLVWYALSIHAVDPYKYWIGLGALEGFVMLTNPSLSTVILLLVLWHMYKLWWKYWTKIAMSLLVCVAIMSPWLIRNRLVFNQWVFIRGNFGFELYQGNHDPLQYGQSVHPMGNPSELADYKRMGEVAYVKSRGDRAHKFMLEHPDVYVITTLQRAEAFWAGDVEAAHPKIAWYWLPASYYMLSVLLIISAVLTTWFTCYGWQLLYGVIFLFPLPYYVTLAEPRYRHPIEPLILLIVVYSIGSLIKGEVYVPD